MTSDDGNGHAGLKFLIFRVDFDYIASYVAICHYFEPAVTTCLFGNIW